MTDAVTIRNLTKKYSQFQLNQVSFTVPSGSIVGLVGENGAGKTTALKAILGLIRQDEGTITVLGEDSRSRNPEKYEKISAVLDSCTFPHYLNALQLEHILSSIYQNWDHRTYEEYLRSFRLPADKKIKDFSRGMRVKLSLAAAFSHNASLLILDESTSGLDPVVRDEILDILLEFIQDESHSVLLSSHIVSDLEKVADYIVFLHNGSVLFQHSKDDLLYSYGVWHCTPDSYESADKKHVKGIRKSNYSLDVLLDNLPEFKHLHPDASLDRASLEDIILYTIRGIEK